jgi:aspartyl-tRNA(Asn)/glutamyl-tRNA(Gln) amidotransferase subunit B
MEQGSLRVDANISLRRLGEPLGTRAEIKNVNSIRFLGQALDYEIYRQLEILEDGGTVIQETRLFDPVKGETRSMRGKENAHDYRYFPDPDLKPLVVTQERIEAIRTTMTELPDAKRNRFQVDYCLSDYDATVLVAEKEIADYYETVIKAAKSQDVKQAAKLCANWLISEVFAAMNRESLLIHQLPFQAHHLAELIDLIIDGTISGKIAKDVFAKMWTTAKSPTELVADLGLQQISDTNVIEAVIDQVLAENPDKVADYKAGKVQLFGFFVGLVMKVMKGKANPGLVNDILKNKL